MSTSISYKGKVIAAFGNDTKTLNTAGTWLEDDITVTAVDSTAAVTVTQELDQNGGIIKHINAVDLSNDTVDAAHLLQGYTAHDRDGNAVTGTYTGESVPTIQSKTVTPTKLTQRISPDDDYDYLSSVIVNPIPNQYIIPSGTKNITQNGTSDVTEFASVTVNVPTGSTIDNQDKTVIPTESQQSVTADEGYTGLGTVTVEAINNKYIGSGVARKSSADLTSSGATVSVPAGYYAEAASKSISTGSAATPATSITANPTLEISSIGVVTATTSASKSVTPSVTAGYVSSGTAGTVTVSGSNTLQLTTQAAKTVTPTKSSQTAVAKNVYTTGAVTVGPIPSEYIIPTGNVTISSNGTDIDISEYATATINVPTGSTITNQNKTVTPTESQQSVTADTGYTGLGTVTVNAISSTYVGSGISRRDETDLTASGATVTVPAGYYAEQETKSVASGGVSSPTVTYDATNPEKFTVKVNVNAGYINSGITSIRDISTVFPTQAAKTVTPTESEQTAVAQYKWTTGEVKVGAIPSTYVGSGVAQNDSDDLTASGATVTVPAGYYATDASKSVATVDKAEITFDQTNLNTSGQLIAEYTQTAGYVTAGTKSRMLGLATQAAKTVTPTESSQTAVTAGRYTTGAVTVAAIPSTYVGSGIDQRDDTDLTASGATVTVPAGYYAEAASKSVASGSATTPATTITANPSISVSSTGLITATASASESITPTVSAGYVSSGTSGTVTVSGSNTSQLTTQAATTITPTKSSQTAVASGVYTTGAVTVAAIPANYITTDDATATAADILSGETAYVDGSKVTGTLVIQHYYTGSSAPSSSLGENGDIYLQA